MAEPERRSALGEHARPGTPGADAEVGVTLREQRPSSILQINAAPDGHAFESALSAWHLTASPTPGRACTGADLALLWIGPGQWLAISESRAASELVGSLRGALADTDATVTDLSHARTVVAVEGRAAREVLAKGCPVDVDVLAADDCVTSLLGHLTVTVHCRDADAFSVYVFRSFGLALWEWLLDAAAEFGCRVV